MKQNKKKTFWPYGILLSLVAIVLACVATIVFASNYPVYEDEYFFDKYQNVKDDYKSIEEAQDNFNKNFTLSLNLNESKDKKNRRLYLLDANNTQVIFILKERTQNVSANDIKANLLLTRPHTNEQNKEFELILTPSNEAPKNLHTYLLKTSLPTLEKGRWQLKLKLTKDPKTIGFFTYNLTVQ